MIKNLSKYVELAKSNKINVDIGKKEVKIKIENMIETKLCVFEGK